MKKAVITLVFSLLVVASFAQSTIKIYRVGDQIGVRSINVKGTFSPTDISVVGVGSSIGVRIQGATSYYNLSEFQNQAGAAYGVTIDAALTAYETAVGAGSSSPVSITPTVGVDSAYIRTGAGYISAGTAYYNITNGGTTDAIVNGIALPAKAVFRVGPALGKTHSAATYNGNGNILYIQTFR